MTTPEHVRVPRPAPGWPLYAHPVTHPAVWERATAMAASWRQWGDGLVVVNVDDGPGDQRSWQAYQPALCALTTAAPAPCIAGYVHTGWGLRAVEAVLADAATWQQRDGLRTLMLDEWCSGDEHPEQVDRSLRLLELLRPDWERVVVNPGRRLAPGYARRLVGLVDAACTAEGSGSAMPPEPEPGHLPEGALRWTLVHSAPQGRAVPGVLGADLAWCTASAPPHPWDGSGSATAP